MSLQGVPRPHLSVDLCRFEKRFEFPEKRPRIAGGMGFDYFYGFMGGETDQWTPYLFRDHTQIFLWIGKPGYNLTTDMADEAINYIEAAQRRGAR